MLQHECGHGVARSSCRSLCCSPVIRAHCNTLQHTTIHYNSMQHTVCVHCNSLQHEWKHGVASHSLQRAATHYNTLQLNATYSLCTLQLTATRMETWCGQPLAATCCNTLQHAATHCNTLQRTAARMEACRPRMETLHSGWPRTADM